MVLEDHVLTMRMEMIALISSVCELVSFMEHILLCDVRVEHKVARR